MVHASVFSIVILSHAGDRRSSCVVVLLLESVMHASICGSVDSRLQDKEAKKKTIRFEIEPKGCESNQLTKKCLLLGVPWLQRLECGT